MAEQLNSQGGWDAPQGSPHRSLTAVEVVDIKAMAEATTPTFEGVGNATWEQHHPLACEIWERRGLKPKG